MDTLQFHSREFGWLPAEEQASGFETGNILPRAGTKHLRVRLPDGREVTRRHVAPAVHYPEPNILTGGSCKLCGVDHEQQSRIGRVYRLGGSTVGFEAAATRDVEPPAELPDPKSPEEARRQAPRTARQ